MNSNPQYDSEAQYDLQAQYDSKFEVDLGGHSVVGDHNGCVDMWIGVMFIIHIRMAWMQTVPHLLHHKCMRTEILHLA